MSASDYFLNLKALEKGIHRKLSDGIDAHIFPAKQSMASVVVIAPNAVGKIHSHPQEQWSVLLKGGGTRIHNGEQIPLREGDFWVAPGDCEHGIVGGPEGAVIVDIFAPARPDYTKPGEGFASHSKDGSLSGIGLCFRDL